MKDVVNKLIKLNKTISTMESCTGGFLASSITNIDDSSKVFKFGSVTYSNEYKIKMGVDSNVIEKYTVYSMETANAMSKAISLYTNSSYGVGITGKLNKQDDSNPYGSNNIVYVSVYDKEKNHNYTMTIEDLIGDRESMKQQIINKIVILLKNLV